MIKLFKLRKMATSLFAKEDDPTLGVGCGLLCIVLGEIWEISVSSNGR